MPYEIRPYEGAIPLRFGLSESAVTEILGSPIAKSTPYGGGKSWDYDNLNVGFDQKSELVHVGCSPGCEIEFQGQNLFSPGAFEKTIDLDGEAMEVVGFVVLLNLGIAFDGFHDGDETENAVSVFVRGAYDSLKPRMKPFRM